MDIDSASTPMVAYPLKTRTHFPILRSIFTDMDVTEVSRDLATLPHCP